VKPPVGATSEVHVHLTVRSMVMVLALVTGVWLAYQLWVGALILVMALVLAGTFNPVIEWLEARGVRRIYGMLLLFLTLLTLTAAVLFLTLPPLVEQVTQMIADAPATRRRLIDLLDNHGVTTRVLSFYLLADGKRTQGVLYAVVPRDYHMRLARILQNLETIVGGYMRGQLITCTAIGVYTFILLEIVHVPNALSLALLGALVDVVPFIGGLLVIIPAVASALPQGAGVAGTILVLQLLYMEFESRILVPRIYGQVLRLPPTAVILALIAGGTLMGILGALLALPIAAGLLMMLEELRVEMPGDDSVDRPLQARHARQEAKYEQMSAGATAPEAGEIAKTLAHDSRAADIKALEKAAEDEAS
jgi:predicted PurR-regulated permease PerM